MGRDGVGVGAGGTDPTAEQALAASAAPAAEIHTTVAIVATAVILEAVDSRAAATGAGKGQRCAPVTPRSIEALRQV
jgi:hypothetical protein